jgi:hypothetical protein
MYRLFVRAALVLALWLCGLAAHQWHGHRADDAAGEPPHSASSASHQAPDDDGAVQAQSSPPDAAAGEQRDDDTHACDIISSATFPHALIVTTAYGAKPTDTADTAHRAGASRPPTTRGRDLLLRQCVSRT